MKFITKLKHYKLLNSGPEINLPSKLFKLVIYKVDKHIIMKLFI